MLARQGLLPGFEGFLPGIVPGACGNAVVATIPVPRGDVGAGPGQARGFRLDAYSKASQLSFFLWNSGPDLTLLEAAAKGDLDKPDGLNRQVKRMMASPRLEAGVRAFFIDLFGLDGIAQLTKDAALFPTFNAQVAADAREETLHMLIDLLLKHDGDYRDIFTTRKTF